MVLCKIKPSTSKTTIISHISYVDFCYFGNTIAIRFHVNNNQTIHCRLSRFTHNIYSLECILFNRIII